MIEKLIKCKVATIPLSNSIHALNKSLFRDWRGEGGGNQFSKMRRVIYCSQRASPIHSAIKERVDNLSGSKGFSS